MNSQPPAWATVGELRLWLRECLGRAGIVESEHEAELLLLWVLACDLVRLRLGAGRLLTEEQRRQLAAAVARRCRREPLAYILGEWEFWSLPFTVDPRVLIPRPETELLVEKALEFAAAGRSGAEDFRILDLGTGSGILAVVLARELPAAKVVAVDRQPEALALARHNARRHGVEQRIFFIASDWLGALAAAPPFDLVVGNPPYVARRALAKLEPEVRDYEPRRALDGGEDGLDDLRRLARQIPPLLRPGGLLLLEIGCDQAAATKTIFQAESAFSGLEVIPDLAGLPRVLVAVRHGS